jgi:surface-anchored protein
MARTPAGRARTAATALRLSLLLLAPIVSACASQEESTTPNAREEQESLQRDVDTVLLTATEVQTSLAALDDARIRELGGKLEATVGHLADAAQRLRTEPLVSGKSDAAAHLSMRAGQLAPLFRAFGRALRASNADAATRARAARALTQAKLAVRSLDLKAGRLDAEANGDANAARTGGALETPRSSGGDAVTTSHPLSGQVGPFYVIDEGHVDAVDAAFEDDALSVTIHDESIDPDVERDPARTILVVKSGAKITLPDSRFEFIGPVGATAWILPENELDAAAAGLLWAGLSTEEVEPGVFVDDQVSVRIRNVIGPNGLSLFFSPQDELSPPVVLADSEDGLPDVVPLPISTHTHVNWAFEAAGVYLVRVDVTGRLALPGTPRITSSIATLKFIVLP